MNCRYSVTCDLGQSHHVLGKISSLPSLPSDELLALDHEQLNIQQSSAILYHRMIIAGILYTTASYKRSKVKADRVLCLKRNEQKFFGVAKHYASFCTTDCNGCLKPCKHIVFVTLMQPRRDRATAALRDTHVYHVYSTRFGYL